MTGVEQISQLEGKRVRLAVGDKKVWANPDNDYKKEIVESPIADWIAGEVPVGTIGTIRPFTRVLMQIVWDGITPKAGYVFGATDETLKKLEIWI